MAKRKPDYEFDEDWEPQSWEEELDEWDDENHWQDESDLPDDR